MPRSGGIWSNGFLARTVVAALAVDRLDDVLVVSPDREVLRRAADLGARTLRQRSRGLNAGLREARADVVAGGAEAILVLPIDLPFVTAETVGAVVEQLAQPKPTTAVVLVTDRHGTGTNVLGASTADRHRIRLRAAAAAAPIEPPPRPPARPISSSAVRSPSTSTPPTTSSSSSRSTRRASVSAEASIRILALDGIPEIREGDDLGVFIGNAHPAHPRRPAADDRRRARRHPEDRVEGRGRRRRPDHRRAAPRGDRVRRAVRPRSASDRGRPARGAARRPDAQRRAHHRDRRTGSSARTAGSMPRTSGPRRGRS